MPSRPKRWAFFLAPFLFGGCLWSEQAPSENFTDIAAISPRILIDIRYATLNNFTHTTLYPVGRCLLQSSVAKRLALVQSELENQHLRLKVWDCYRPLSVQKKLWALVPDDRYVANPANGSRHNRGAAIDVTLTDDSGKELEMPTGYDDFTFKAHRDFTHASPQALKNRKLLEAVMMRHGFEGLSTEWWHFDAEGWQKYPLMDAPLEK